jgi:integrase/recombinase XerD
MLSELAQDFPASQIGRSMLDFYFTYRGVLRRLRSGALGHEMDRIAAHFFQLVYKRASAKIYISRLARFSEFAAGVIASGPITPEVVDRFLLGFLTASPRIAAATAIEHA